MFVNEDTTLYICRYLPPDDVVALVRASRDIRAMLLPHMRYVVKTTPIVTRKYKIICKDIIRPRFARRDIVFEITAKYEIIRPNIIPHDYTGRISIQKSIYSLNYIVYRFLWAVNGFIVRRMQWYGDVYDVIISRIEPIHFIDYLHNYPNIICTDTPNDYPIINRIYAARAAAGARVNFAESGAFEAIMRDVDLL